MHEIVLKILERKNCRKKPPKKPNKFLTNKTWKRYKLISMKTMEAWNPCKKRNLKFE